MDAIEPAYGAVILLGADEDRVVVDVARPIDAQVAEARRRLRV